uniref:long-chain-fatty-acid--CoA ligase n=1 Tax=Strigamia maritima TaxID=126957 RepID=T1J7B1_STRMM
MYVKLHSCFKKIVYDPSQSINRWIHHPPTHPSFIQCFFSKRNNMVSKKFVFDLIAAPFIETFTPKHQLGPDYIIPRNENRTWQAGGAVHINLPENLDPKYIPESVISIFRKAVENSPNRPALLVKKNSVLRVWSYAQYWQNVTNVAKGFIKLGVIPFHSVGILASNSPEWLISYLAAIFCGGLPAGIYTTNSPMACLHVLENSSANLVLVDSKVQLDKILSIRDKLPHLKMIILLEGNSDHPDVISWQDLLSIGQTLPDEILEKRIKGLAINQCCGLIYTSGTTGNPKGVMVSHDSIITMSKTLVYDVICRKYGKTISYLPLSHVAALAADLYVAILTESAVYFAHPDALKGKLVEDLIQAQPTYFTAVPRVYDKIKEKLQAAEVSLSPMKKKIIKWARKQIFKYNRQIPRPTSKPIFYASAKALISRKVKTAMGINDVEVFISGGAPISVEVIQFFLSYDIIIVEVYGLSECSGIHIMTMPKHNHVMGSVGNINTIKEFKFKILNPTKEGVGEILLNGRNIFMGYLGLEEMTKEALEEDNWLHTGDIGYIDTDGFLFITGRIKELIITSGGENIPPVLIEEQIKKILPVLSNCMLIGDKRNYLTILLTLKTEINISTMEPIDELNPIAIEWCQSVGSSAKRVSEILQSANANVMDGIQQGINKYNEEFAISRAQKIQKWTILPQDFSINNGTLGPTAKLKRQFVVNKYSCIIESMYAS